MYSIMIILALAVYLILMIGFGLYVSKHVQTTLQFFLAGRSLSLRVLIATSFVSWFGANSILGSPTQFIKGNLGNVIEDPIGTSSCMIIVGLFFAHKMHRLKLCSVGEIYRMHYGRTIELMASSMIILSYIGWLTSTVVALGLVFNIVTFGTLPTQWGSTLGLLTLAGFCLAGGMVSVAAIDYIQSFIILIGLSIIATLTLSKAGGIGTVVEQAHQAGKFSLLAENSWSAFLVTLAGWMTTAIGLLPQQDVFQRVCSAKTARESRYGFLCAAPLYLGMSLLVLITSYAATLIDPSLLVTHSNSQLIFPTFILEHMPFVIQIIFFGALIAGSLSCGNAALLAPATSIAEEFVYPLLPKNSSQKIRIFAARSIIIVLGLTVLGLAVGNNKSVYGWIVASYQVTLVGPCIPIVVALCARRPSRAGAFLSLLFGPLSWLICSQIGFGDPIPPHLIGFFASIIGMLIGSLLERIGLVPCYQKTI